MTRRFLAVGINKFAMPGNNLNGCIPDCHAMQSVALTMGITADALTDQAATKKNIVSWLSDSVAQAKRGMLSYIGFSFSAHGTHWNMPSGGLGEALVCFDIAEKGDDWDWDTIIRDCELHDLLNQIPQGCDCEIFLDSCFSGGMDRAFLKTHGSTTDYRFMHNPGNTTKTMRIANSNLGVGLNSNIIMWTASSAAQESADAYISGGSHGAFTWAFTQAYTAKPKDLRVNLLVAARNWLNANGYSQFPRLKCWNAAAQLPVGA